MESRRVASPRARWSAALLATAALTPAALTPAAPTPAAGQTRESPVLASALDDAIAAIQSELRASSDIWEDHSSWDNAWECRSEHYRVRTTRSHGHGVDIARGLDEMLGHFQSTLGVDFSPPQPFQVFLFPDVGSYNQFGDDNSDEHSSFYGSFAAAQHTDRPVAAVWLDNPTLLRMQITHSAVHQFVGSAFPGVTPPTWINEGLAAYFSLFWSYEWAVSEFERLAAAGSLIGLRQLTSANLQRYGNQTQQRMLELGMLFYYLLRYREDTRTTLAGEAEQRGPFRDYLIAVLRGQDATALPVHALTQDLPALERDFRAFEFPR